MSRCPILMARLAAVFQKPELKGVTQRAARSELERLPYFEEDMIPLGNDGDYIPPGGDRADFGRGRCQKILPGLWSTTCLHRGAVARNEGKTADPAGGGTSLETTTPDRNVGRGTKGSLIHRLVIAHPEPLWGQALAAALGCQQSLVVVGAFHQESRLFAAARGGPVDVAIVSLPWPGHDPPEPARRLASQFPGLRLVVLLCDTQAPAAQIMGRMRVAGIVSARDSLSRLVQILFTILGHGRPRRTLARGASHRRTLTGHETATRLLALLTEREREVLSHVARGMTASECAFAMDLSPSTVENHKWRMMRKLGVHKLAELVQLAVRGGLLDT